MLRLDKNPFTDLPDDLEVLCDVTCDIIEAADGYTYIKPLKLHTKNNNDSLSPDGSEEHLNDSGTTSTNTTHNNSAFRGNENTNPTTRPLSARRGPRIKYTTGVSPYYVNPPFQPAEVLCLNAISTPSEKTQPIIVKIEDEEYETPNSPVVFEREAQLPNENNNRVPSNENKTPVCNNDIPSVLEENCVGISDDNNMIVRDETGMTIPNENDALVPNENYTAQSTEIDFLATSNENSPTVAGDDLAMDSAVIKNQEASVTNEESEHQMKSDDKRPLSARQNFAKKTKNCWPNKDAKNIDRKMSSSAKSGCVQADSVEEKLPATEVICLSSDYSDSVFSSFSDDESDDEANNNKEDFTTKTSVTTRINSTNSDKSGTSFVTTSSAISSSSDATEKPSKWTSGVHVPADIVAQIKQQLEEKKRQEQELKEQREQIPLHCFEGRCIAHRMKTNSRSTRPAEMIVDDASTDFTLSSEGSVYDSDESDDSFIVTAEESDADNFARKLGAQKSARKSDVENSARKSKTDRSVRKSKNNDNNSGKAADKTADNIVKSDKTNSKNKKKPPHKTFCENPCKRRASTDSVFKVDNFLKLKRERPRSTDTTKRQLGTEETKLAKRKRGRPLSVAKSQHEEKKFRCSLRDVPSKKKRENRRDEFEFSVEQRFDKRMNKWNKRRTKAAKRELKEKLERIEIAKAATKGRRRKKKKSSSEITTTPEEKTNCCTNSENSSLVEKTTSRKSGRKCSGKVLVEKSSTKRTKSTMDENNNSAVSSLECFQLGNKNNTASMQISVEISKRNKRQLKTIATN